LKNSNQIRTWASRIILAAGIVWVAIVFSREFVALKATFVVDSVAWLAFTIVAGCVALLLSVPVFRTLLAAYARMPIALSHSAHMLFVAQILRHLPGRVWGIMYLVNETHTRIPAASMVRANVDFMLFSMSFNVLVAAALFLAVTISPDVATICAAAGVIALSVALRRNWIGAFAGALARIMPARMKPFTSAVAEQPQLSWPAVAGISSAFVLVWCCYLSIWWALTQVFGILGNVNIWLLCASYSLAWVVGYLAMITPGGIGVREAGFFALASPLMSLPELTFLAVFIRLWQILVESLMFVAFAFVKPETGASDDGSASSA
jgi:uncharacterized membrane protein YbhN (UPF0104 family)